MAGSLDYVRRGEAITAEKWNALVERINALEQRQTFDFRAPRKARGGGLTEEEVEALISARLSSLLKVKTLQIPSAFGRDSDGYLTLEKYQETIKYYGIDN